MKRFLPLALLTLAPFAQARPYTDQLGICYVFTNGKMTQRAACVISAGYGAGAHYMSLGIGNRDYYVESPNMQPNQPPTLDGKTALFYKRDAAFFSILKGKPIEGEDYVDCVKTRDGKTDVCYLIPQ